MNIYEIKTLKDMLEKIPTEKFDKFLNEFIRRKKKGRSKHKDAALDEIYKTSNDYEMLYNLCMLGNRIICIVNYNDRFETLFVDDTSKPKKIYRDVASVFPNLNISSRGFGYNDVYGDTEEEKKQRFIDQCKFLNVKFIMPNKEK